MRSTPPASPARSKSDEQEASNISALKKATFPISNSDVSPVLPVNVSVSNDWIYHTISGSVKYAPFLGDLGNYVKSNHKASAMLTTRKVAAMHILTLAVQICL
jgi:hypothetical protein